MAEKIQKEKLTFDPFALTAPAAVSPGPGTSGPARSHARGEHGRSWGYRQGALDDSRREDGR